MEVMKNCPGLERSPDQGVGYGRRQERKKAAAEAHTLGKHDGKTPSR